MSTATMKLHRDLDAMIANLSTVDGIDQVPASLDAQFAAMVTSSTPEAWDTTISGSPATRIQDGGTGCSDSCAISRCAGTCDAGLEIDAPVALVG